LAYYDANVGGTLLQEVMGEAGVAALVSGHVERLRRRERPAPVRETPLCTASVYDARSTSSRTSRCDRRGNANWRMAIVQTNPAGAHSSDVGEAPRGRVAPFRSYARCCR
jgi:UDP-glucose 4-epimerase